MRRTTELFCFVLFILGCGLAQDNEVSFSVGPLFKTDERLRIDTALPQCPNFGCTGVVTFSSDAAVAFSWSYARRITSFSPAAALYVELPMAGQPSHTLRVLSTNQTLFPTTSEPASAFFVTPAAKVQVLRKQRISPWATAGYGLARITRSATSHTGGAAQFGGGIDFKVAPQIALRGEVRDFWSNGTLQSGPFATLTSETALTSHIHHLFAGGGVVLRF